MPQAQAVGSKCFLIGRARNNKLLLPSNSVLRAAGGITFHIWRKQMLRFWELRIRAVIVSVSTSEKNHASASLCPETLLAHFERCSELRRVYFLPWGTSRLPAPATRLRTTRFSWLFFRLRSSPPPGKACCSSVKW